MAPHLDPHAPPRSMALEGSRQGAHRRRGSPADRGRGGAMWLAGGGARARRGRGQGRGGVAPRSPRGLLLLPLERTGRAKRWLAGGGRGRVAEGRGGAARR